MRILDYSDVEFYVDKESREVTCCVKDGALTLEKVLSKVLSVNLRCVDHLSFGNFIFVTARRSVQITQLEAKAKCSPDDTFDVKKGMEIAMTKLELRLLKHLYRTTRKLYDRAFVLGVDCKSMSAKQDKKLKALEEQ